MKNDNSSNQYRKITEVERRQISPSTEIEKSKRIGLVCPNCGADLEGRKCKLVCPRPGCGYLVTCSEW